MDEVDPDDEASRTASAKAAAAQLGVDHLVGMSGTRLIVLPDDPEALDDPTFALRVTGPDYTRRDKSETAIAALMDRDDMITLTENLIMACRDLGYLPQLMDRLWPRLGGGSEPSPT